MVVVGPAQVHWVEPQPPADSFAVEEGRVVWNGRESGYAQPVLTTQSAKFDATVSPFLLGAQDSATHRIVATVS